jgi:hypothetical protein
MRLQVGKTYSDEYVSTYPRQQWRGRALCRLQVGPARLLSLLLLLPPPFPIEANGIEGLAGGDARLGGSGPLRPSSDHRRNQQSEPHPFSKTAGLGKHRSSYPHGHGGRRLGRWWNSGYGYSGERVGLRGESPETWGSTGVERGRGGVRHCSNLRGRELRPWRPLAGQRAPRARPVVEEA